MHEAQHIATERQRLAARPSATARGYGSTWRKLRADYISTHPMCETPGCLSRAALVDHIIPMRFGGSNDLSNLQSLCERCHQSKSRREQARDRAVML